MTSLLTEAAPTDLMNVTHYYGLEREGNLTLYDIWESGRPFGDSMTPSTCLPSYRRFMEKKIKSLLGKQKSKRMLSVGSGNAVIEAGIVAAGVPVTAVDLMPQAVEIARRKGLYAHAGDILNWAPDDGNKYSLIYADGVLGHLFNQETGCGSSLKRFRNWLEPYGLVVISNDAPSDGKNCSADGVPGFQWLSSAFLVEELVKSAFEIVSVETFRYMRPISGSRRRAIVVGRKTIEPVASSVNTGVAKAWKPGPASPPVGRGPAQR